MTSLAEVRRNVKLATARINKGSKYQLIVPCEEVENTFFLRRPSGIMNLDCDTGGGLPAGGTAVISGPDGAGKTYLLYNYFAAHQRIYGDYASILYAPVEFLPDYKYMQKMGLRVHMPDANIAQIDRDRVNTRRPKLTKQEIAELQKQVGFFEILRAQTAEEYLDAILTAYASRAFHIIAVDSISMIMPDAEAALETLDKNPQQAALASLMTRFFQHLHPLTSGLEGPNSTTLILTAQVRSNRNKATALPHIAKYLKDWATTGAHALRHGKLMDIQISAAGKEREGSGDSKRIVGKLMKWELVKAKAGSHDNIFGEHSYMYDDPGDYITPIYETAIRYGAAQEIGKTITFLDGAGTPLVTDEGTVLSGIPGKDGLRDVLRAEPAAEWLIRRTIHTASGGGTCLYT
jgi:RecA/RadA recombinase